MKTIDNILRFIESKGYSVREFEKKAQLGHQTIMKAKERSADLSPASIDKIVDAYSTELIEAGFYIIDLTPFGREEKAIIEGDKEFGEPYDTLLTRMLSKNRRGRVAPLEYKKKIPFYDAEASAGNNIVADTNPVSAPAGTIDVGDLLRDSESAIRVYGNSMIPNYPPGCVVGLIKRSGNYIEPGEVYVVETRDSRLLKRLFYKDDDPSNNLITCYSDNILTFTGGARSGKLAYPPFDIPKDDIISLYSVTGVIKRNSNSAIIHKD